MGVSLVPLDDLDLNMLGPVGIAMLAQRMRPAVMTMDVIIPPPPGAEGPGEEVGQQGPQEVQPRPGVGRPANPAPSVNFEHRPSWGPPSGGSGVQDAPGLQQQQQQPQAAQQQPQLSEPQPAAVASQQRLPPILVGSAAHRTSVEGGRDVPTPPIYSVLPAIVTDEELDILSSTYPELSITERASRMPIDRAGIASLAPWDRPSANLSGGASVGGPVAEGVEHHSSAGVAYTGPRPVAEGVHSREGERAALHGRSVGGAVLPPALLIAAAAAAAAAPTPTGGRGGMRGPQPSITALANMVLGNLEFEVELWRADLLTGVLQVCVCK